jgi:hypothetical protein
MGEGWTGGASDIVKAESSGEDPRATGALVSGSRQAPQESDQSPHWFFFGCLFTLCFPLFMRSDVSSTRNLKLDIVRRQISKKIVLVAVVHKKQVN